jgi:alpha-tubulin suppressor-like RCC1 family protein
MSICKNVFKVNDIYDYVVAGCRIGGPFELAGTLWTWGYNNFGQLADSTTIPKSSPIQIPGTSWNSKSLSLASGGGGIGAAIKYDGTLWGWGRNYRGTIGDNTVINRSSPVQVPGNQWRNISRSSHTTAIKSDGTFWSWGYNTSGQLGVSDRIHRSSPIQVPGTQWCFSQAANSQSFGLKCDGTLWTWGNNNGTVGGTNNTQAYSSPVQVPGTQWVDLCSRYNVAFGRKSDGTLWSWGCNTCGQLGDGTILVRSSPVQIPGNSWVETSQSITYISQAFARKTDGTLWSWGYGALGGLGTDSTIHRSSPVQIPGTTWSQIAAGQRHGIATKTDGTLWVWGTGNYGALGTNSTIHRSSPVQIPGTNWFNGLSAGERFVFARKIEDGPGLSCPSPEPLYDVIGTQLWGWGRNDKGRLGTNDQIHRCSPVNIPGGAWCQIKSGSGISLGIKTDNTLWSWGYGASVGALGLGALDCLSSPVQIPGTAWCRAEVGTYIGMALKTDNTLWIWGQGATGRLGNNTIIPKSSPIQIPGTWCDISASLSFASAVAIKTDNTLWGWGYNNQGLLGDGTVIPRSSPVQVPGTAWCDVSMGYRGFSAIKTDGTLWSSGFNNTGMIGDGTIINRSSPVQVPGTSWCSVETGAATLALKTDNTLWSWGNGYFGSLGNSTAGAGNYKSSPIQIPGTQWVQVSKSGQPRSMLARKSDNTLWAWGRNNYGQLGQGDIAHRSSPTQIPGTCWINIGGAYSGFAIKCFTG